MLDQTIQLIPIFTTSAFGALTFILGYTFLQNLTSGRLKDFGMKVWYAIFLFSVGGALNTYQQLTGVESIKNIQLSYFEYFFYIAYYIMLLFAIFSLYHMSKSMGFNQKTKEMMEALKEIKGVGEGDGK